MAEDPRQLLNEDRQGLEFLEEADSQRLEAFTSLSDTVKGPGALDRKTKELIGLGIAMYTRCKYCIAWHTDKALEAGATREELIETGFVAGIMGGGPTIAYSATLLKDAINTFAPDYGK
ncbi:hypothetical protein ES703_33214 [subsurface metagenome]